MRQPWSIPGLLSVATATALVQKDERSITPLSAIGVCSREGAKLVGTQPIEARGKLHMPRTIKRVPPQYPPLPAGTSVVTNYWIGEVLIDAKGHLAEVWTIKEPQLRPAFPAVTEAIVSAFRGWEWEPLIVDKKARPFCKIMTLRVDWP
jgi:hypothetical protein